MVAHSRSTELAGELLTYFVNNGLNDCFAASLYQLYGLLRADTVMEMAWKRGVMDLAMPFFIQTLYDAKL